MSYLSSNRKERSPTEQSERGSARRLRSRLVVSADNRRCDHSAKPPNTTRARKERSNGNDTTASPTTPNRKAAPRSRRCRRGTAAGGKIPPIRPRRQPPALDKRPTKPARTCGTRCATAAQCSGGHSSSPNRATRTYRLRANRPPVERISTDGLRKELAETPCSEDRGKRDRSLKHSHRLYHCIMGVKGQDEQPISVGFWIGKGLPLTPHVAQPAKRSVFDVIPLLFFFVFSSSLVLGLVVVVLWWWSRRWRWAASSFSVLLPSALCFLRRLVGGLSLGAAGVLRPSSPSAPWSFSLLVLALVLRSRFFVVRGSRFLPCLVCPSCRCLSALGCCSLLLGSRLSAFRGQ